MVFPRRKVFFAVRQGRPQFACFLIFHSIDSVWFDKEIHMKIVISFLFMGTFLFQGALFSQVRLRIDVAKTEREMKGGIGASWHAIAQTGPYKNSDYDYPLNDRTPWGSAYGGNPPVKEERLWQQMGEHARWLGLDWIRVELAQRMYEPAKNKYDWENEEMQALYRILAWAQQNGADVFLQQMWGEVAWNSFPEVHPLLSAPASLPDFAEGLATLADYLINKKGFKCIKWLCITNEPPGGTWGYWWGNGSHPCVSLGAAFKAVREALDQKGLNLPVSGPDWTDLPPFDSTKLDFDAYLGAYDIHSYQGVDAKAQETLAAWANWAHARNKPFFLSEMGNMKLGWGKNNPGPRTFAAALSNAESVIRGIRAGVDGFNRWSFTNRGDLDGQWQLIRTWDMQKKAYFTKVTPEPVAYYGYAMMTRFLPKHSSRISDEIEASNTREANGFLTTSMKTPGGNFTTFLLNMGEKSEELTAQYDNLTRAIKIQVYQATESLLAQPQYRMEPLRSHSLTAQEKTINETLPPRSITVFTTYDLRQPDGGMILENP
jgi:hypothetical protein